MGEAAKKKPRINSLSDSHRNQISVLRAMAGTGGDEAIISRLFHINEISELSGLKDAKETQRYLFILEGQKLVTPTPEGDFTSESWKVTRQGVQFMKIVLKTVNEE